MIARPMCSYRLLRWRDLVVLTLPIRTVSEPNARDHWAVKHRNRSNPHRSVVGLALRPQMPALGLPVSVRLTRLSAGTLDTDNLLAALKAVRDGVADALGLSDDSDPRVWWSYAQRKAPRGQHGVEIAVARMRNRCDTLFARHADGRSVMCLLTRGHLGCHHWEPEPDAELYSPASSRSDDANPSASKSSVA